jgi:hypothetical protein
MAAPAFGAEAPALTETFATIEGTASMIDHDDAHTIAKEVAGVVATTMRAQFELAKPVEVRHDFNGFGKMALRVAGGVILLLVSVVMSLVAYVWLSMGASVKDLEGVARQAAGEVHNAQMVAQVAQAARDDKQDANLQTVGDNVNRILSKLSNLEGRWEAYGELGALPSPRLQHDSPDDRPGGPARPKRR